MKKKLLILGEVHEVGYRPFLLGIAESLEIERFFADNTKINGRKAVYILVDSSQEKVGSFIEVLRAKHPERAIVESITVEDYSGNVMKTENYYRYLSAMQLSKIANIGGKMLEKQDLTISEIREVKKEVSEVRKEVSEVKKEVSEVKKEVSEVRKEVSEVKKEVAGVSSRIDKTNSLLDERFNRMENEIEKIKKALVRAGIEV